MAAGMKSEVARPYVEKYKKLPHLTLARIIYNENVSTYTDVRDAYDKVRYLRGKYGKSHRKTATDLHDTEPRSKSPLYDLPESWAEPKKAFKMPVALDNILFLSDLQVPFHDKKAIQTAVNYGKDNGCNAIYLNGDVIDFYGISFFIRDARQRNFKTEYDTILASLEWLREENPDIPIYYNLDANHEFRYYRYMMVKAPELLSLDLEESDLAYLLRLNHFGITPIQNYDHIMIGKLPVVHGHTIFMGQTSPASPARTVYMKAKKSCIASHCHQTSEYNTKTIHEEPITCWTTGCLMSLNVEYNKHGNNYNHGFATIKTEKNGNYMVNNRKIFNGKVF